MLNINDFIIEKLKINSKSKINQYKYHPKDKKELNEIISKLTKERGLDADLNDIDTSKINNMEYLFMNRPMLHADVSEWDVSNVTNMESMFFGSKIDCDLSKWDVRNVTNMKDMFKYSALEKNPPKWYHE